MLFLRSSSSVVGILANGCLSSLPALQHLLLRPVGHCEPEQVVVGPMAGPELPKLLMIPGACTAKGGAGLCWEVGAPGETVHSMGAVWGACASVAGHGLCVQTGFQLLSQLLPADPAWVVVRAHTSVRWG